MSSSLPGEISAHRRYADGETEPAEPAANGEGVVVPVSFTALEERSEQRSEHTSAEEIAVPVAEANISPEEEKGAEPAPARAATPSTEVDAEPAAPGSAEVA